MRIIEQQAVACFCGWCGAPATIETETWWICDGCHEAEQLIEKYKAPQTEDDMIYWMGRYLTSWWAKGGNCRDCGAEALVLGPVCQCGYDGREA